MARVLEAGLSLALLLLPLAQSGGKDRGKDRKKEAPRAGAPARFAPFAGKLPDARKLAKERNAGLLIHIVLEGEQDNDTYRDKLLPDPELVAACERVVVVVSNNGTHASKSVEETVDGKKVTRSVCSAYPWFESCTQHSQHFNDLALEYRDEDGSLRCPQTVLLAPDGSLALRIDTGTTPPASEILAGLEELEGKFGPGLLESEWIEIARLLEEARAPGPAGTWPVALRKWQRVLAISPRSSYGTEAAQAAAELEKRLAGEVERVAAGLVPGTAAAAWRELSELQRACAGLALEKEIAARLKKAEARKEIQAEIAVVKLEAEADQLLRAAQELSDQKKDKELEKTVRKLLSKRFAATPAAARARELWPQWARDEDSKVVR